VEVEHEILCPLGRSLSNCNELRSLEVSISESGLSWMIVSRSGSGYKGIHSPFHLRAKEDRFEMTLASFFANRSRASRMRISSALSVTKQLVAPKYV
jgi:hypothetical protein